MNEQELAANAQDEGEVAAQQPTEQEQLGKFASAGQLYKAYRALEAEFTKRCQELKALQAELTKRDDKVKSLDEKLQNIFCDEAFVARAASDPRVADAVLKQYLLACAAQRSAVKLLTGGVGVTASPPPKKPKTLEEAKQLAKKLLQ